MDNVLIQMPSTLFDFLVSLPVIQDYQLQLVVGGERKERDPNFQISYRMDEKFAFFAPAMQVVRNIVPNFDYSGYSALSRGEFDCYLDMDIPRAIRVTKSNPVHITMALGILVGAGPQKWPVIRPLEIPSVEQMLDVLILKWGDGTESSRFAAQMLERHPDLLSIYDDRDLESFKLSDLFQYINSFKIVIGKSSAETYIAATYKKALIEIFDNFEDRLVFSNDGVPVYQQVIGNPSMEVMWRLWEERWQDFQGCLSDTSKQSPTIPMEPPVSTVDNVAER